ncbi:hypothetical protein D3C78_1618320 [compost metagenome]
MSLKQKPVQKLHAHAGTYPVPRPKAALAVQNDFEGKNEEGEVTGVRDCYKLVGCKVRTEQSPIFYYAVRLRWEA